MSRSRSQLRPPPGQLEGCQGSFRCRSSSPVSALLYLYAIALFVLAHCTVVDAGVAQDSVIWVYPEGGEMFYFLDTVNVTYQSSVGDLWMFILCYKDKTVNSITEGSSSPHISQSRCLYGPFPTPSTHDLRRGSVELTLGA